MFEILNRFDPILVNSIFYKRAADPLRDPWPFCLISGIYFFRFRKNAEEPLGGSVFFIVVHMVMQKKEAVKQKEKNPKQVCPVGLLRFCMVFRRLFSCLFLRNRFRRHGEILWKRSFFFRMRKCINIHNRDKNMNRNISNPFVSKKRGLCEKFIRCERNPDIIQFVRLYKLKSRKEQGKKTKFYTVRRKKRIKSIHFFYKYSEILNFFLDKFQERI